MTSSLNASAASGGEAAWHNGNQGQERHVKYRLLLGQRIMHDTVCQISRDTIHHEREVGHVCFPTPYIIGLGWYMCVA